MAKTPTADDIKAMSFEEALAELERIVERLESGDSKLDDAIVSYERGAALKLHCETKLREAQDKVEKIKLAADGSVTAEPTEIA
jgi:exodeoxyribonuclease VII small subunit